MFIEQQYRKIYSKAVHGMMLLRNHRINRHIVVFESDDWGSVRMPSLEMFDCLQKQGVRLALPQSYDSVDTLASNDDLELLMEVLSSVKDADGNPAKITLNCCVANPDFGKIKKSDFQDYYYEPFTETLKHYPHHDRAFDLWKEGIAHKVFQPQFHGREHLNPQKWLRYLQEGNKNVLAAFDAGCYSMAVYSNGNRDTVLEAYKIDKETEREFVRKSISDGLVLFEKLFGFKSKSMIAPCYIWAEYIEQEAADMGVSVVQGGYIQSHSSWQRSLGNRITGHYFGEKNNYGQSYLIRNCSFEPSQLAKDSAVSCMASIIKAFSHHLPAIVSCHRLNFVGDLKPENRDNNLKEFKQLLQKIVTSYPDVVFMSSDELGELYQ